MGAEAARGTREAPAAAKGSTRGAAVSAKGTRGIAPITYGDFADYSAADVYGEGQTIYSIVKGTR